MAARVLDPDRRVYSCPGSESVVIAPSLNQGRIVYRFARDMLGDDPDYRFADSFTLCQITHKPTRTVLQVRSSSAKGALGLVNTPWVILDEPGAFNVNEGEAMFDAIIHGHRQAWESAKGAVYRDAGTGPGRLVARPSRRRLQAGSTYVKLPTGRPREVG